MHAAADEDETATSSSQGHHLAHSHSYRYQLTTYGRKVALFFTKSDARVFHQFLAAVDTPQPIPLPLAAAFEQIGQAIAELAKHAHLAPSAA